MRSYLKIFLCVTLSLIVIFTGKAFTEYLRDKNDPLITEESFNIEQLIHWTLPSNGNGEYYSTEGDANMELFCSRRIKKVEIYTEYYAEPGEVMLFYLEEENESYTIEKSVMARAEKNRPNWYSFDLGTKDVYVFRIDPTNIGGNRMVFGDIIVNGNITFTDYMDVSVYSAFKLLFCACVISTVIKYLFDVKEKI